jgi:hypothetical protein
VDVIREIKLRIETRTTAHTTTRVFINDVSAGLLTMTNEEFDAFASMLMAFASATVENRSRT